MRNTISNVLCVVLAAAMVVAAVGIGAVRGWNIQREEALTALSETGALGASIQVRAMDAANLAVVAERHLTDDADVATLRHAYNTICGGSAAPDQLAQADDAISAAAASLAEKLTGLDSVQASSRDRAYISSLTRSLSETSGASTAYAAIVEDYNSRLESSPTGRLAMLLGVAPLAAGGDN